MFHPTGNAGGFVSGADTQAKGAFLYGGGINYALTRHWSLRAEYRGYVYKDADFGVRRSQHGQLDAHGATIRWNCFPILIVRLLAGRVFPACHGTLIVVESLASRCRTVASLGSCEAASELRSETWDFGRTPQRRRECACWKALLSCWAVYV